MTFTGRIRVYFNRSGAAPLMWCVAPPMAREDGRDVPRWEIAVRDVVLDGVRVTTAYHSKPTPDDEDGRPSAWLEAEGVLTIGDNGVAVIARAA